MNEVQLKTSGVEANSSLDIGEKLHELPKRIYKKIRYDHPTVMPQCSLRVAVKVMNDAIGENCLVPYRLAFGTIPRFPIIRTEWPRQKKRMKALITGQAEMNERVGKCWLLTALAREIPPAADRAYTLGKEVVVYWEQKKEWSELPIVIVLTGRMITVCTPNGNIRKAFNAFRARP